MPLYTYVMTYQGKTKVHQTRRSNLVTTQHNQVGGLLLWHLRRPDAAP